MTGGAVPRWFLPAVLGLAVLLRVPGLEAGLWYDEIETLVAYVRRPLADLLGTYDSQNQHLLYSALARIATVALGESPLALRLPAALFGVAAVAAFFFLARRITRADEAMVGTAALAVSYHAIWFSQNARGYTGLLFFTLVATLAFRELLNRPDASWRLVLGYGAALALAGYTHMTAAFLGMAHGAVALWVWATTRDRRRIARPIAGLALGLVGVLLLYLPVLDQLLHTLTGQNPWSADTEWQRPLWLIGEMLRGLAAGLPGGWLAVAAAGLVVAAGLRSFWRQDRIVAALLVLPPALTGVGALLLGHNLWPRFFFFAAGFAILIAVRGGFEVVGAVLPRRGRRAALALATLGLLASAVTVPRAWGPKQDFGAAAQFVDQSRQASDAVVTVDLTAYPYRAYYGRDWPVVTSVDSLIAIEAAHRRTWLLYTFPIRLAAVQPGIWERLRSRYDTAAVYPGTVGGGNVVIMVTRTAPVEHP